MKKILVALLVLMIFAIPFAAEAQQKKKKKDEPLPLPFFFGQLFGTANCLITCTTTVKTLTVTVIRGEEPFKTTLFNKSTGAGAYVAAGMACAIVIPMLNAAAGNREPTSEEMVEHVASCFIPGLGLVFLIRDLSKQQS